jgi:exodeoxyribonuclease VII large subunit
VARGGGSLEDRMAFNEEVVVRAAAACRIPLISAVGHETDTTLIDFAADRRAPTPTAAAELAVPARADLLADLAQTAARLIGALNRVTQERRLRLSRAERGLPDLPALVGTARQRLDDRAERLRLALPNLVRGWAGRLTLARSTLAGALRHTLAARRDRAVRVLARVSPAPLQARLREARARLDGAAGRLESVSPLAVLQRGYALVTDRGGHPLTTAAAVAPGASLRLRFADGEVGATADGGGQPERQGRLAL